MTATSRKSRSPLALAIALALVAGATHAATIKVTTDQDNTTINDGLCTLREAIVAVNQGNASTSGCINIGESFGSNDTIEFDSGLVGATITISGSELAISKPMAIVGTGQTIQVSGTMRAMQVVSGGSLDLSTVTISGGDTSANGAGLNVSQANASLTYVTVTGNNGGNGAGIYAYNSTLTLTECTVNGNTATGYGGGVLATHGSNVTLSSTSVYGNSANIGAGAAVLQNAQLTLSHSSLTGNAATSAGGGAAALNSSTITVSGGFVTANSAGNNGGGVYAAYSSQLTLNDLLLADNAAHYGGGAWVRGSTVALNRSTVSGNSAVNVANGIGGFLFSTLTLTDSTVVANISGATSSAMGGGVGFSNYSTVNVVNSTISGNTASTGGGLNVVSHSTLTLVNSTITGNDAYGGGIAIKDHANAYLDNTVVSHNYVTPGRPFQYSDAIDDATSSISASYSLLGTGPALDSSPNTNADRYNHFSNIPLLNSLANNGGPTQTMAPMVGSQAIGNGSVARALSATGDPLNFDQRGIGFPRTLSGKVDIGAYQREPTDRIFVGLFEGEP